MQCKSNPITCSTTILLFQFHWSFISKPSNQSSKIFPMKKTGATTTTTTTSKKKKKMTTMRPPRGFICHSTAATAVCMPTAMAPSVILPRKLADHHHFETSINNTAKYSRLVNHDSQFRFVSTSVSANNHNKLSLKHHLQLDQEEKQQKSNPPTASSSHVHQVFQVVVMRVSIHCQGCAGKLKKHLAKMEGVTSYSIDLDTKRVTVMGHVSPDGVLESISKVKKAEFWPN